MYPTDLRLLAGIRAIAEGLEKTLDDPAQAERVRTINVILDELLKRQNEVHFRKVYEDGANLVRSGNQILLKYGETVAEGGARFSSLAEDVPGRIVQETIHRVSNILSIMTEKLSKYSSDDVVSWLDGVIAWEVDLWSAPLATVPATSEDHAASSIDCSPENVEAYLNKRFPARTMKVSDVRSVPGGFSKVTALVSVQDASGALEDIVLRAQKPVAPFFMDGADIENEFPALEFVHKAGLPVAKPLWLETNAEALGLPFMATSRIVGRNYGDFLGAKGQLPMSLIQDLIETIARVHRVDIDLDDPVLAKSHLGKWAQFRTIRESTRAYVKYWQGMAAKGGCSTSPALARGFSWLLANVPECDEPPTLVHGDFGLHNVMIHEGRIAGILDWEACYIGDPADEFFLFTRALSAQVSDDQIMNWYVEAGGRTISSYRRRYYAVLSALKGPLTGIAALNQVAAYPSLDLKPLEVSYRFVLPSLEQINQLISEAEGARS